MEAMGGGPHRRSLSSYVELALEDHLRAKGGLPKEDKP